MDGAEKGREGKERDKARQDETEVVDGKRPRATRRGDDKDKKERASGEQREEGNTVQD